MTHVLIADDDRNITAVCVRLFSGMGCKVSVCHTLADVLPMARAQHPDLVFLDLAFPDGDALEVLGDLVNSNGHRLPVVIFSGDNETSRVVKAMRLGAEDFLHKPVEVPRLKAIVESHRAGKQEPQAAVRVAPAAGTPDFFEGQGAAMQEVHRQLASLASVDDTPVVLLGESGVGKEVYARRLHDLSIRRDRNFVAVNCPAIPESLIESELFGHTKGAFTDARETTRGLLLEAQGGTLFLDEVGELPLGMQAKLLRFLETRTIRPVGGTRDVVLDVRVVAATNRDLKAEIQAGRFRLDLFYRLCGVSVWIPPLRERGEDVVPLIQFFLHRSAERRQRPMPRLEPEALAAMASYAWPGNVRELRNVADRLVIFGTSDRLGLTDLPEEIREAPPPRLAAAFSLTDSGAPRFVPRPLEDMVMDYILEVYHLCGENKNRTAKVLGISRQTLLNKLARYNLGDHAGNDTRIEDSPGGETLAEE